MKIGVYGSATGEMPDIVSNKAREIGREIARREHELITGACPGFPYDAVLGANEVGGLVTGFSPGISLEDHIGRFRFPSEGFSSFVFIPSDFSYKDSRGSCLKLRNVFSVTASDAVVIIGGRWGTVNEFSIAYELGRDIAVLAGSGGFAELVDKMVKYFDKPSSSRIIYSEEPIRLVHSLEKSET